MQRLNATVSPILQEVIDQLVGEEGIPPQKLSEAVTELSHLFTKGRSQLKQSYLDHKALRAAYLQYFMPVNLAKVQVLLNEMPVPEPGTVFSVLDLGSGPGTGALAVLDWWDQLARPHSLSMITVDSSAAVLGLAKELWARYCQAASVSKANLQTLDADLEQQGWVDQVRGRQEFDLIVLANCLNEVYVDAKDPIAKRGDLVREALSLLTPHGALMIIEPALRSTSRELHQVRDRLLQETQCSIYSPCLHEKSCPALVKPDDWCHEERAWDPPGTIQEIDEQVGFIKDALKFSYLLIRKDGKTIAERRPDVYRVVSELRELKGEKRAWLCNEQGRQEVGRQDRLVSPQNESLDQWHRGALVQIEKIFHKERKGKVSTLGRIEGDTAVQIVRSV
ncbi:MAG: methyltransferase domain-containing protein [Nitrospira sp.]|nr:methyltransferase domain-containing protein [Nitrospira sp.]